MDLRSKLKHILGVAGFLAGLTSTPLDDKAVAWLSAAVNDDAEWALVVKVLAFLGVKVT